MSDRTPTEATPAEVDYVLRYGGRCRDCADRDGVCETGLPCGVGDAAKVIRHVIGALNYGRSHGFLPASPPAPAAEPVADLEEAIRLAEIGEFLYSHAYSYGDGYTEPREYGIEWQWQQTEPNTYGQGALLAASTRWHEEQAEDGTVTEAAKLRSHLTSPIDPAAIRAEARREAAKAAASRLRLVADSMDERGDGFYPDDLREIASALITDLTDPRIDKAPGR